jgi:heme exporter protein D
MQAKDLKDEFGDAIEQTAEGIENFADDPTRALRELTKRTDFTKCDTWEKKNDFRGDWTDAYFGPKVWDTKGVTVVAMAVFPATAAKAWELILKEIKNQGKAMLEALRDAASNANENLEVRRLQYDVFC